MVYDRRHTRPNASLDRIGDQRVRMQSPTTSETAVMNRPILLTFASRSAAYVRPPRPIECHATTREKTLKQGSKCSARFSILWVIRAPLPSRSATRRETITPRLSNCDRAPSRFIIFTALGQSFIASATFTLRTRRIWKRWVLHRQHTIPLTTTTQSWLSRASA